MQKIRFIVDTPSDIPDADLARCGIKMVGVPIVVDGKDFTERESFSTEQFYDVLQNAKELPVTSRVPVGTFADAYSEAWEAGCTDIIVVTINAGGSGTNESAQMAVELFYGDAPEAKGKISIHIVDSKTYAMAYGYPVMQASTMAEQGKSVADILAYLHDFFDRVEIYLACYTLEYAKRSGRITAAAAFVGDVLGLRPIIAMIDGTTKTVEKVRGDKNVAGRLLALYRERRTSPDDLVLVVSAAVDAYGDELQKSLEQELGRPVPQYKAGASITINAGPRISAICLLGKKRGNK